MKQLVNGIDYLKLDVNLYPGFPWCGRFPSTRSVKVPENEVSKENVVHLVGRL